MADYRTINRANWDERAPAHAASPDYDVESLVGDPEFMSKVVRFDLSLLGDIAGLPWEAFPGKMERLENGEWRLADRPWRLPHSYTLQAVKRR